MDKRTRPPFPTWEEAFTIKVTTAAVGVVVLGSVVGSDFLIGLGSIYALAAPIAFLIDNLMDH